MLLSARQSACCVLTLFGCLLVSSCRIYAGSYFEELDHPLSRSRPIRAQHFRDEGKYEDALNEYKLHFEERLADENRAENENPYFYYLLIGDTYLEMLEPNKAEEAYLNAKQNEVETNSLADRFRRLGNWFETHDQPEKAIEILIKYRDLDPLIFDSNIDRLHRKIVSDEQQEDLIGDSPR